MLLLSTPRGKRGHFYRVWKDGINWKRVQVKATECPRISEEELQSAREDLDELWFDQEYMVHFNELFSNYFTAEEIEDLFTDLPEFN